MARGYCNTSAFLEHGDAAAVAAAFTDICEREGMRRVDRPAQPVEDHPAAQSNYWSVAIYPGIAGWTLITALPFELLASRVPGVALNRLEQLCQRLHAKGMLLSVHDGGPTWAKVAFETDGAGRSAACGWWFREGSEPNDFYGTPLGADEGRPLGFELLPKMQALLDDSGNPAKSSAQGDSKAEVFSRHLHQRLGGANAEFWRAGDALVTGAGLTLHGAHLLVFEWPVLDRPKPQASRLAQARQQLLATPHFTYADGSSIAIGDAVLFGAGFTPALITGYITDENNQGLKPLQVVVDDGASEKPNTLAQEDIAKNLRFIARNSKDFRSAGITWLTKRAKAGNSGAALALAHHYAAGQCLDKDEAQAFHWMGIAVKLEHPEALFRMGQYHFRSLGTPKNLDKGLEMWKLAAMQGQAEAQYNLGLCHEQGVGLARSVEQAVAWYQKAANQGWLQAQCKLADKYERGAGVPQNYETAMHWYGKAVEQGMPEARYRLSLMFHEGRGTRRDFAESYRLLHSAATGGYPEAQYAMGRMHEEGGDAESINTAKTWYRSAADSGHAKAAQRLKELP